MSRSSSNSASPFRRTSSLSIDRESGRSVRLRADWVCAGIAVACITHQPARRRSRTSRQLLRHTVAGVRERGLLRGAQRVAAGVEQNMHDRRLCTRVCYLSSQNQNLHVLCSWHLGDWETCSHSCGKDGWQYRVVFCKQVCWSLTVPTPETQVLADGKEINVNDSLCLSHTDRPVYRQVCNRCVLPRTSR